MLRIPCKTIVASSKSISCLYRIKDIVKFTADNNGGRSKLTFSGHDFLELIVVGVEERKPEVVHQPLRRSVRYREISLTPTSDDSSEEESEEAEESSEEEEQKSKENKPPPPPRDFSRTTPTTPINRKDGKILFSLKKNQDFTDLLTNWEKFVRNESKVGNYYKTLLTTRGRFLSLIVYHLERGRSEDGGVVRVDRAVEVSFVLFD